MGTRMDFKGHLPNGRPASSSQMAAGQDWITPLPKVGSSSITPSKPIVHAQSLAWSTDICGRASHSLRAWVLCPADEVSILQQMLSNSHPDAQARTSLLKKLAIARRVAADRLAGRNNPALQAAQHLPPPQSVPDRPCAAVFPGDGGLFHAGSL